MHGMRGRRSWRESAIARKEGFEFETPRSTRQAAFRSPVPGAFRAAV